MDQMHHLLLPPTDPAAKLPHIHKPLLFLTVRDVGLALVEEENRPGKKEVMSRSKCQRRLLGLEFAGLGCVRCMGPSMVVCGCGYVHPTHAATDLSGIHS